MTDKKKQDQKDEWRAYDVRRDADGGLVMIPLVREFPGV